MTPPHDDATTQALNRLLEDHDLTADSRLYREALFSALASTSDEGVFRLAANENPVESVVDVYGPGYVVQAASVGAGLAFAESATPNWQETMELRALRTDPNAGMVPDPHVEVEVRISDILRQGGLLYPVESVTVERAWYCTLPARGVEVRVVL